MTSPKNEEINKNQPTFRVNNPQKFRSPNLPYKIKELFTSKLRLRDEEDEIQVKTKLEEEKRKRKRKVLNEKRKRKRKRGDGNECNGSFLILRSINVNSIIFTLIKIIRLFKTIYESSVIRAKSKVKGVIRVIFPIFLSLSTHDSEKSHPSVACFSKFLLLRPSHMDVELEEFFNQNRNAL